MGKSIFTMSAAQRLKAQQKQSKRFDRAVNKKFKAMKKAWKKKIAGKVLKGTAFVATAAVAGAAAGKVKEIVKTKSGDELREMASKIKVKFEEKKATMKKQETGNSSQQAQGAAVQGTTQDIADAGQEEVAQETANAGRGNVAQDAASVGQGEVAQGAASAGQEAAARSARNTEPSVKEGAAGTVAAEKAAEEINQL